MQTQMEIDAKKLIDAIASWLVCAAITTPDDMAQSFNDFYEQCEEFLEKYEEKK